MSDELAIFDEMKAYVGFGEADVEALAGLWPIVAPHVVDICEHFYGRILASPAAREVLRHERQVAALKGTLGVWLQELLTGPHNEDYYRRRRRVGTRHVEVAMPPRFMFTGMSVMAEQLECIIDAEVPDEDALAARLALRRITDLDLAIMTGTFVEARERRQIATLQSLIVTHLPVAALVFDQQGTVTAATTAAGALLLGEPVGRDWRAVMPPELLAAVDIVAMVEAASHHGLVQQQSRVDVVLGTRRLSLRVTVVPLDHAQARVLLHLDDLSEAVELEARMQQSEALARLGSLSAVVAHELRNPLAGMSTAIQVLVPTFDEGDARTAVLGKVIDQVRRLDVLVEDLLAFARPGQASVRSLDLRPIAEGVVELVRSQAAGFTFEVVGEGRATADPNLVHQILLNLVQNALHAQGEQGRVRIEVGNAWVAVEDDGPGVPDDMRDDVFKPFFTTRTRGTGLGLAICSRSAAVMEAELVLEERGGLAGARFELLLAPDTAT